MALTMDQLRKVHENCLARHEAGKNPYVLAVAAIKAMTPEQKAEAEEQAKSRPMPAWLVHPRLLGN
jgi:hypothetical protein